MKKQQTIATALLSIVLCCVPLCLSAADTTQSLKNNTHPTIHRDQRIPWVKPVIPLISTLKSNRSMPPAKPQPSAIDVEEKAYKEAFSALKNAQYKHAIKLYRRFIERYPNSKHTAGSHFWVAEACFLSKNYEGALEEYAHLMIYFPDSLEAEQAALKSALTFHEMTNWPRAQKAFKHAAISYPHTITAQKAQNHLKSMKRKGLLAHN